MTETKERPAPHRCPHEPDDRRGVTNDEGIRIECTSCGIAGFPKPNIPTALNSYHAAIRRARREGGNLS